jgi:hypothetical protein
MINKLYSREFYSKTFSLNNIQKNDKIIVDPYDYLSIQEMLIELKYLNDINWNTRKDYLMYIEGIQLNINSNNNVLSNTNVSDNSSLSTMNLSKRSEDKELFFGEQSSKKNTMNLSKQSGDKELLSGEQSSKKNTDCSDKFIVLSNTNVSDNSSLYTDCSNKFIVNEHIAKYISSEYIIKDILSYL